MYNNVRFSAELGVKQWKGAVVVSRFSFLVSEAHIVIN